jgi:hypothetical protein
MREFFGLVLGLYLTVAIAVFGGAAYGFMSGEYRKHSTCATEPDWIPWALYRAAAWPKTYFDDQNKANGIDGWLLVQYDPLSGGCAAAD